MANENGQTGGPLVVHTGANYATDLVPSYAMESAEVIKEFRLKLEGFLERLNSLPRQESIDATPDGRAYTILISHVETTLDEYFFGLWEHYDFKWSVILNEVVGSIILEVIHPVTGTRIRRTGAAAIQIMVDAIPEDLKEKADDSFAVKADKKRQRNQWANTPDNKKPSALDMGFPKLKAECVKNAAQSLGKLLGRDLNRKKSDNFQPLATTAQKAMEATKARLNGDDKIPTK